MATRINLSNLMKSAWTLFKSSNKDFASCLRQAWKVAKAKAAMKAGNVHFLFKKVDGTIREANGTLANLNYTAKGGNRKPNYGTVAYYDLDKQSFRCFKVDNFIGVIA